MDAFSMPYRFDRDKNGEQLMVYIWDTISSKILEKQVAKTILSVFFKNLISENSSGYFAKCIIRCLEIMKVVLIILIMNLTLNAVTKKFCLLEI